MAMNVFGSPITVSTLRGMVEYKDKKEIRRVDKAKVALNMKNARGNDVNVYTYFHSIGHEMREEPLTLCVMYNATGGTLTYVCHTNWEGNLAKTPFPVEIANGQWAGFIHINPWGLDHPSKGAVVYRGKNSANLECDFMFAWYNPWGREKGVKNKAFTEVREAHHYELGGMMDAVKRLLDTEGKLCHTSTCDRCFSSVSIGNVRKGAFVEAIFTLEEANASMIAH